VVTTLSRGGLVSLALTSLVVLALPARSLFRNRAQKAGFVAAAAVGLVVVLALTWASLAGRFQEGANPLNRGSGRGDLWLAAMHGYQEHPVLGIGYGAFLPNSQDLLATTPGVNLKNFLNFTRLGGQEVHSAYIGSLAELGPLGLLFFVAILLGTLRSLVRTGRAARAEGDQVLSLIANALSISMLAFISSSIFLSSETSGRALWAIVGLSLVLPRLITPAEQPEPD
jgi:O-antigen ligase